MSSLLFANNWQIDELLSHSAKTTVHGVTHQRGQRGALKLSTTHKIEEHFIREVTLTERASTAGSPDLLGYGASGRTRYLISERVIGDTLQHHVVSRDGRLDIGTALLITERLAHAVGELHALGIVHRDLEPTNVLISAHGHVKLVDYSIAAMRGAEDDLDGPSSPFAAPEQIAGVADPLDVRADVFAVGALLYWMLTAATEPLQRLAYGIDLAVSIDEIAHLPFDVIDVVDGALAREPHRRIPSARALARVVSEVRRARHPISHPEYVAHQAEELC